MRFPTVSHIRERIREQDGATLSEVLVAELIGGIVLTAAAAVMMIAFNSSARVSDKVNAASQGRNAVELVQQRLRSQTCLFPQEYSVNSIVPDSGGQRSFVHASPTRMIFIGDIGNSGGATNVAGSVGFRPQFRYIWFNPGPTTGKFAGRKGKFLEGWKSTTNTAIPFNFNTSPLTGVSGIDQMATQANGTSVPVDGQTVVAEGVTNEVTSSNVPIPFFRYYDAANAEIPQSGGTIPTASLGALNRVNVTFKILAESGKDHVSAGTAKLDRRTASFSTDVYLRVNVDGCN